MKVDLNERGDLLIIPENGLESYAIEKWYNGFKNQGDETISIGSYQEE